MTPDWNTDMSAAPRDGICILATVDGETRIIGWGKVLHIPLYGWVLLDQGPEDVELCKPTAWMPLPEPMKEAPDGK